MDSNKHILRGSFCKQLTSSEFGLGIEEILNRAWDKNTEPNSFADGSNPIDGVWDSYSIEIGGFKILSVGESVDNHSTVIFDVFTRS